MTASRVTGWRARLLGLACFAALVCAVAVSLSSMRRAIPAPLSFLLLPGSVLDALASGRAGYEVTRESTAFLNITAWSVLLIGTAAFSLSPRAARRAKQPHTDEALVPIYVSGNPAELPVIQSLLTEAGIPFMVKGEQIQGMFGGGQFGGSNLVVPLEICVLPNYVEAARELLRSNVAGPNEGPAA